MCILAISSTGGHWSQLMKLRPAFANHEVIYACTESTRPKELGPETYYSLPDANKRTPLRLLQLLWRVVVIMVKVRPRAVVSTGAAPGALGVVVGRLFGARTIWLDSAANAERLSLSRRIVQRFAGLWLTQWPHLAKAEGPYFCGSLLSNAS